MVWGIILDSIHCRSNHFEYNGLFPASGTATLIVFTYNIQDHSRLGHHTAGCSLQCCYGDTADQQELVNSKRQEGIFFASAYFSIKASYGIGQLGVALTLIGWPDPAEITDLNILT